MTLEDYKTLREQVKGPGMEHMRIAPYQQDDGSAVALIEDFLGQQRWICSLDEWRRCVPTIIRSCLPSDEKKTIDSRFGKYHHEKRLVHS
jgi:hypothetical protein